MFALAGVDLCLIVNAPLQCGCQVIARLARNRHPTLLYRMNKLAMTPLLAMEPPAVTFDHLQNFSDFHASGIPLPVPQKTASTLLFYAVCRIRFTSEASGIGR